MTQPSIDSLARSAFVPAAPRRRRLDDAVARVALAMSVAAVLVAGIALLSVVGAWAGGYRYEPLREALAHAPSTTTAAGASDPKDLRKLEAESKKLLASLERRTPRSSYVVIDRTNNLLYLRKPGTRSSSRRSARRDRAASSRSPTASAPGCSTRRRVSSR